MLMGLLMMVAGTLLQSPVVGASPIAVVQSVQSTRVTVALAERTRQFEQLRAVSDQRVVLVITLKGFTSEQWQKLDFEPIYLIAGSSKFNCVSKRQGRVDGSGNLRYDDHRLAFDVPIAETKFVLHLQDGQKIEFAATGAIKPKID